MTSGDCEYRRDTGEAWNSCACACAIVECRNPARRDRLAGNRYVDLAACNTIVRDADPAKAFASPEIAPTNAKFRTAPFYVRSRFCSKDDCADFAIAPSEARTE